MVRFQAHLPRLKELSCDCVMPFYDGVEHVGDFFALFAHLASLHLEDHHAGSKTNSSQGAELYRRHWKMYINYFVATVFMKLIK